MREYNFDGLVGPTHNYGGLSTGNLASTSHFKQVSNPLGAVLEGLDKMRLISELGVGQALLPPQQRPSLRVLRALGFQGSDEEVIAGASEHPRLLSLCSSSAAMWAANAATCTPSSDTTDHRVHLSVANLHSMFHRAIEADATFAVLKSIFEDPEFFSVHAPLPGGEQFADEGAANHLRLVTRGHPALHLFAWGRASYRETTSPRIHPARQTEEASQAVARAHLIAPQQCLFPQQNPIGIDAGAFHTDVLAVGNESFLMLHAQAFADLPGVLSQMQRQLGPEFSYLVADQNLLTLKDAIDAYPFNSQIVTLPDGTMALIAPQESQVNSSAKVFLEQVVSHNNPIQSLHYLNLSQSMQNGGGPACLRLRIGLTEREKSAIRANVFYTPTLHRTLQQWAHTHYRDRLVPDDLKDPCLARESMEALDQLTQILRLGSIYDFQSLSEV